MVRIIPHEGHSRDDGILVQPVTVESWVPATAKQSAVSLTLGQPEIIKQLWVLYLNLKTGNFYSVAPCGPNISSRRTGLYLRKVHSAPMHDVGAGTLSDFSVQNIDVTPVENALTQRLYP